MRYVWLLFGLLLISPALGNDTVVMNPLYEGRTDSLVSWEGLGDPLADTSEVQAESMLVAKPVLRDRSGLDDIVFIILIFSLVTVIILQFSMGKLFSWYASAFLNFNLFLQLLRETRAAPFSYSSILFTLRVLIVSLCIYFLIDILGYDPVKRQYFLIAGMIASFWLVKYISAALLASILEISPIGRSYLLQHHILFSAISVILIPFCFISYFILEALYGYAVIVTLLIFLLLVLYYAIRLLSLLQAAGIVNLMHIFIYLCAFEIVPAMLMFRLVERHVIV